ncbi:MAG TPA: DUF1343 domain-containing protein [Segetibacter sp.]|jgi:uncharacterized protein YbbC (DUF1343 family)
MKRFLILLLIFIPAISFCQSKKAATSNKTNPATTKKTAPTAKSILPGAYQTWEYLPRIKGKRVGIFANHTATIGKTHLVDSLKKLGVKITKIFGPEHGFRGDADAGEKVGDYIDKKTGIQVISLYGTKRKPSAEDLADVDVMIFDIQDVGVRFYTYISHLQDFMESSIEHEKPLLIFDRPNPNGFYVDGPVLDTAYKSFVGMQSIPVVYGMTIGEYANFLVGQGLLDKDVMVKMMLGKVKKHIDNEDSTATGPNITIIKCLNYTHKMTYNLPVKPSPNLPDAGSVFWYPSTCFFEGTVLSEGRGTSHPFQIFGHPSLPNTMYAFTPVSRDGAKTPKLQNQKSYGWNLTKEPIVQNASTKIELKYLLEAYRLFPEKENFFIAPKKDNPKPTEFFFNKLAGNSQLMQQIKAGKTEEEIRASWQPRLEIFKKIRKRYLMYPDFDEPNVKAPL